MCLINLQQPENVFLLLQSSSVFAFLVTLKCFKSSRVIIIIHKITRINIENEFTNPNLF